MDIKLNFQTTAIGNLLQDDKIINFFIRVDLTVSKNKKMLIADEKSGMATSIEVISAIRQLLEYSKVFNNRNLIFIDTE